jgi:hypothetical protein
MSNSIETVKSNEVTEFVAMSVVTGKTVTMADKVQNHIKNGANVGAMLSANIGKKAIIEQISNEGLNDTIHKLSAGNIRPAVALIVAKSGKAVSIMEIDGKAPYAEWLRLGATLSGMTMYTKAGKPTNAKKALDLFNQLNDGAKALRDSRAQLAAINKQHPADNQG